MHRPVHQIQALRLPKVEVNENKEFASTGGWHGGSGTTGHGTEGARTVSNAIRSEQASRDLEDQWSLIGGRALRSFELNW